MSKGSGLYSVMLNNNFSINHTSGAYNQFQSLLKSFIGMHIQIKTFNLFNSKKFNSKELSTSTFMAPDIRPEGT